MRWSTDQTPLHFPRIPSPAQALPDPFGNGSDFPLPEFAPGWPTGYAGAPVQASSGQPIPGYQPPAPQQPMGTTLNATQQQPNVPQYIQTQGGTISGGAASTNAGMQGGQWVPGQMIPNPAYSAQQQQQAPQQSMQPANQGSNYQSALTALANPGTPPVVGSPYTAQQSQAGAGNQGVLNNLP